MISICMFTVLFSLMLIRLSSLDVDLMDLENYEFAIVQYDSRPPADYWHVAAEWNKKYCEKHGHVFIFYTTNGPCHYNNEPLASPWCKVKAMIDANRDFPDVKFFIYMDSDAVIDIQFSEKPLNNIIGTMQERLNWNPLQKPVVFNQDGPCWWCRLVVKVGYNMCLNAGTVAWFRHEISTDVLQSWWDASMDSYETNPIKRRFRIKWPWEQDRQMAIYNRSSQFIQIASQPERITMQSRAGLRGPNSWCLSHLPGSGCFISHYCSNAHEKQVLKNLYGDGSTELQVDYNEIKTKKKKRTFRNIEESGIIESDGAIKPSYQLNYLVLD